MDFAAKTRTEQILVVMYFLAWVAMIGFLIKAGGILFSYSISIVSPDAAKYLYDGLDLHELREFNFWHYTLSISFLVVFPLMKAYVSFLALKTLSEVNMINPFTSEVSDKLERISYALLGAWMIAMLSNAHTSWIQHRIGVLQGDWIAGDFIFMAGLVFIISKVFKRGVELQSENDLTV
jgi:hypothetical protein